MPLDELRGDRAIDQADRAVVPQEQRCGDVADRRTLRGVRSGVVAADRQQQLVLSRRNPERRGLLFAPLQESAQGGPESEEFGVLGVREVGVRELLGDC